MKSSSKIVLKSEDVQKAGEGVTPADFPDMAGARAPKRKAPPKVEGFQSLTFSAVSASGSRNRNIEGSRPAGGMRAEAFDTARNEADALVKGAQEKAALIEREAYESGYKQGEKTGIEIGEKRFDSAVKSLGKALADFRVEAAKGLADMESEVIRLSLAVARKVIHAEVLQNSDVIIQNLKHVLKMVTEKDTILVRLHPADAERAKAKQADLTTAMPDIKSLTFQADESIPRGGAIVETSLGDLDARLDEQFGNVEKSILKALEERRQETEPDGKS
ncbi:MAG: hypothetical protein HY788_12115 [Deltaproteobacteria bacterium]|nr:hypothetical protein [Deltaproteobacteria bacterium]